MKWDSKVDRARAGACGQKLYEECLLISLVVAFPIITSLHVRTIIGMLGKSAGVLVE